ncbi:MAG: endonuclease/exonuclease/phosphatase family protein [Polyangiaceae bacterium]|nr:endonuclease/exonuclease/phosphatase family protein [Polyangiaceae bacterium]
MDRTRIGFGGFVGFWLVCQTFLLPGCPSDSQIEELPLDASTSESGPDAPNQNDVGPVGTPDTFDFITWNLQEFPKSGQQTIDKLTEVLSALQPDVVAVQEITDGEALMDLAASIPGWQADVVEFFVPGGIYNPPVGMLWNSQTVQIRNRAVILEGDSLAFPRPPLKLEITWNGFDFVIINVHLKASGDNVIQCNDPWDEEMRRIAACERLHEYITENHPDDKVIVAGDFNDKIEEPITTNVFMAFLSRPDQYMFADMRIAKGMESVRSYPTWNSHIDHILISNELFASYYNKNSLTRTIAVDKYFFSSWAIYNAYISDHRPVLMHLEVVDGEYDGKREVQFEPGDGEPPCQ